MTDHPPDGRSAGLPGVAAQASEAAAALGALPASAKGAADAIEQVFARAGASFAGTLSKAAGDGKLSLGELAGAAIAAVDALAKSSLGGGSGTLADALAGALKGVFGGARADGGPVAAGGAYLVGERGPEVFRPDVAGSVEVGGGAAGVTVNVTVDGGGAPALLRSEAQVAAAMQRAVALGSRR